MGLIGCIIPFPVFPEHSQVIAIGKFAVKERNENAGTDLEFVKVMVGVKWSVVAATFYMIDIRVKSATDTKIYLGTAKIVEAFTGHKKLLAWNNIYIYIYN
ncbi:hypothetical protein ACH5RR_017497 [Cinchona calisaya]|uniref:Cystatin domain-containing protein n=1 Tax=Cinchona calisaya TaxID=153742 RepID=A0ABD2ZNN6_9GENT